MKRMMLAAGLLTGAALLCGCADYPPPYYGPPSPHVQWCLAHHPGYNPANNLFPGPYGGLRPCRYWGPYGPPPPPPPPAPPPAY